jgi:hypothetical protein
VIWSSRWNGPVVIIGLILLALALLLPALQQAREAARRTQSEYNLKQIGLALLNYHSISGMFPPGGTFNRDGKPFHGWMSSITPYLDASPWHSGVDFQIPWDDPKQIDHFQPGYGEIFLNPSISCCCGEDGLVRTHYAGVDTVFYHNSSTRLTDLSRGHSQTLLAGEAQNHFEPFGYSYNWRSAASGLNASADGFGSAVRDVTLMLLVDGSVRGFSHATDQQVFAEFQGVNKKWEVTPPDVSAPPAPYHVSAPVVCLWVDLPTCKSLLGVQNESQQLVRAWFLNSGRTWHRHTPPTWDHAAELLKSHKSLREVNVRDALSDKGFQVLTELPNLEIVRARGHSLTDRGIETLCRCKRLKHLDLDSISLGDRSWTKLASAPCLESINISFSWNNHIRFTPESVVKFLTLKPDCKVSIYRGNQISIETIRELARDGKPWPAYQDEK